MEPKGNFKKQVLVIGDFPTERDDEEGTPFQGRSGRMLQRVLAEVGVDLFEDCLVMNAVNCYTPEGRSPTAKEISCCRDVKVLTALNEHKPKMVLVLGNVALTSLLGARWTASKLGGINKWAGWTIPDQDYKTWICPTFSPSYVESADAPEVTLIWEQHLANAVRCLKKKFPVYKQPNIRFTDVSALDELQDTFEDGSIPIAFDYEATGIKPHADGHQIICASIAYTRNDVIAFLMPEKTSNRFVNFLRSAAPKIASNMKYEDHWSNERAGSKVKNWYHDTMLWAHIFDNRPGITSLKFQTYVHFGIMSYEEDEKPYLQTPQGSSSNALNKIRELLLEYNGKEQLLNYNALDSIYEYRLAAHQINMLNSLPEKQRDNFVRAYKLIHEGILALARAERQGIRVDVEVAKKHHDDLTGLIANLEGAFKKTKFFKHWQHAVGGKSINIDSNQQLAHFLYKVKKLDMKKTTDSGQGAVDEEALAAFNIPELNDLLRLRKLKKLRDTYLNAFISESVKGVLHPFFNLHIARTYRSSSDSPNFQNIPVRDEEAKKIIRQCLFPRRGYQIVEIDFAGIEVRGAACYHKDPTMIRYIKDPTTDMHGDMAQQIFCFKEFDKKDLVMKRLRNAAKNGFVFPQFYGDYYKNNAHTLSEWAKLPVETRYKKSDGVELTSGIHLGEHLIENGITSWDKFVNHLRDIEDHFWNVRFPVYNDWKKKWFEQYQKTGYFDMYTGFRCSGLMKKNDVTNYPVQGAAFHCLLWSFIEMDKLIIKNKWKTRLIGQIHDSMLLDVYPPELNDVLAAAKYICEAKLVKTWKWIIVPMVIEAEVSGVDKSWYEKEAIELT